MGDEVDLEDNSELAQKGINCDIADNSADLYLKTSDSCGDIQLMLAINGTCPVAKFKLWLAFVIYNKWFDNLQVKSLPVNM